MRVQRSDDDGLTWRRVGDPIVGQAGITANATFNNQQGNLVADSGTHNVYTVYIAGETGVLKGRVYTRNQIVVSRSTDMGKTWTGNVVFTAPAGTHLDNIYPAIAVDSTTGTLHVVWSDGQRVSFASSGDQGNHWSSPVQVSSAPATTAMHPSIAAHNGTVDIVYYGTSSASRLDPAATWHVYFAQYEGGNLTQSQVNAVPNHYGVICTNRDSCTTRRTLLDLFHVAIDPLNGKAAIVYVDDTLTVTSDPASCFPSEPPCPLPQAVLAEQN